MNWLEVIVLSVLQGVAEFLPISSSGHLFLLQRLFGLSEGMLFFDVMLHFASGLAIVIILRKEVWELFQNKKLFLNVVIATVPVVIIGLLVKDFVEVMDKYLFVIGIGLILTSIYNFLIDKLGGKKSYLEMPYLSAFKIGLLQIIAILPGVSRSGSTIVGGSLVGLSRTSALKFSFLMALPAIFGASGLELFGAIKDHELGGVGLWQLVLGVVVCFVVSYLTIKWFLKAIKNVSFKYFALYTLLLGLVVIFLTL